jgi:hypothetical protein
MVFAVKTRTTANESGAPEAAVATSAATSGLRWYVVHAYSGMEKAVERNLRERIERSGMQAKFGRILVPMEEVVEVKNGQIVILRQVFFGPNADNILTKSYPVLQGVVDVLLAVPTFVSTASMASLMLSITRSSS